MILQILCTSRQSYRYLITLIFLIESGQNKYVTRLNDLHVKVLRIIDCNKQAHATDTVLEKEYGLLTPTVRRHEHHRAIMYRQCRVVENLDVYRPPQ